MTWLKGEMRKKQDEKLARTETNFKQLLNELKKNKSKIEGRINELDKLMVSQQLDS